MATITPQEWNEYILKTAPSQFLQSWEWGQFQDSLGRETHFIQGSNCKMIAVKLPLKFGFSYLYIPRGPVGCAPEEVKSLLAPIINNDKSIVFIKYEPVERNLILEKSLEVKSYQPKDTSIVDLTKSEQELLAGMHEKTRYNIRLAEKKGVTIEEGINEDSIKVFTHLLSQTAERDRFHLHEESYYHALISRFTTDEPNRVIPHTKLYLARYEGEYIAGALIMHFGDTAVYLHGASGEKYRNVMAPYLLHWHAIKMAKSLGIQSYDLGGTAPEGAKNHPWEGITRFKRGFGGVEFHYPGTYDMTVQAIPYRLYRLAKNLLQ